MYTPEQQVAALSWMPTASKQEEELRVGCDSGIAAAGQLASFNASNKADSSKH